jgi:hypothetical protein
MVGLRQTLGVLLTASPLAISFNGNIEKQVIGHGLLSASRRFSLNFSFSAITYRLEVQRVHGRSRALPLTDSGHLDILAPFCLRPMSPDRST